MALVESSDLALQPSPVLLEAVLKVDQVVSRLQNLQSTISGIQLSPVNPKHTRALRANATTRALSSKDCSSSKDSTSYSSRSRDECRRKSLNYNKADSKPVENDLSLKSRDWKQWSSPANQVHDVISEILMASEFAKQIATLVAEALQDGPQKKQEPVADQVLEPKKKTPKDGKRRDIAFPSKAQVQKTMSAKAPPSKAVNKFKVAYAHNESAAKLTPPVRISSCGSGPRRISRASSSSSLESSSPPHQKLFISPSGSVRDDADGDADDELAGPRRHSMNVTEIKSSLKPWKLTPTKGVLFSNPVYLETSPPKVASPSPVRIVPTTGRRRSWLTHQFPRSQKRCSPESDRKLRSSASSKAAFKREAAETRTRKVVAPPSRYVEMVPLDGPRDTSLVSTLDVLKARSPSRLPTSDHNARRQGTVEQCRASRSHAKPSPVVENLVNSKRAASVYSTDKENAPLPSCAPSATKFLRSMSSGQSLHRTSSRKNSAVSLLQRAKGWMSSQVARQGKVRELDRSPEARGFTSTRRYSLPGQLRAITASSRRLSLPGHLRVNWKQQLVLDPRTKPTNYTQPLHVFKVMYPVRKPVLGSSLFPGSVETFMAGPNYGAPSTLNLRRRCLGKHSWLRRAIDLIVSI